MELHFSSELWGQLVKELERRSDRRLESGAFLLGTRAGSLRSVQSCVYYDDLAENSLYADHINVPSEAYQALWRACQESGLRVVADVHTHPGDAIQSKTDKDHPMIPEIGHVAMILPTFAARPVSISAIGLYEYLGSFRWRRVPPRELSRNLLIDGRYTV